MLRGNVGKALGFSALAGVNEVWSHDFHWADLLFDSVLYFVTWLMVATVRDRRRARRAATAKADYSDPSGGLGELGKPGVGQCGGAEAG